MCCGQLTTKKRNVPRGVARHIDHLKTLTQHVHLLAAADALHTVRQFFKSGTPYGRAGLSHQSRHTAGVVGMVVGQQNGFER